MDDKGKKGEVLLFRTSVIVALVSSMWVLFSDTSSTKSEDKKLEAVIETLYKASEGVEVEFTAGNGMPCMLKNVGYHSRHGYKINMSCDWSKADTVNEEGK